MIVGLFPELTGAGGIQRSGCLMALALQQFAAEHNTTCALVGLNDPSGAGSLHTAGRKLPFAGCGGSRSRFGLYAAMLAIRQPTITVALHPNLAPVVAAMKLLAPGMRSLVVVHGAEVWTSLPPLRRWALRSADRVLAPTNDTMSRAISEQHLTAAKCHRLSWSLGPEFQAEPLPPRSSPPFGFPSGRIILTVGRWDAKEAYKGVDHLIAAMLSLRTEVPDVHLVVIGEGTDLPRLQSLARADGLIDHVHFLPFVPHDDLPNAYDHCDVFAMPSRGEGFGLVFIEAMARGKPVIGGAHGGTPEVIDHGINGFLVQYGNVPQLLTYLKQVLANDSLRRDMGAQALAKAQRDFTFERFSSDLRMILEELSAD